MSKSDPNLVNSWSKFWPLYPKHFRSLLSGCNAKKKCTTWRSAAGIRKHGFAKDFSCSGNGMLFWTAEPKRGSRETSLLRFLPTPSLLTYQKLSESKYKWKIYFHFNYVLQTLLFFLNWLFSPDGYSTLFGRNKLTSEHQEYLILS